MKLFLADGRLGNQIFQYVFLKTIQRDNEQIITSGFEDLKEVFEIDDIVNLNKKNKWLRRVVFRICRPIFNFISDKGVISSISVDHEDVLKKYKRESITFTKNKGLFSFITFVKPGFFQSEKFFDSGIANNLKIKDKYVEEANNELEVIQNNRHKVFVHIRRGDYMDYYICGKGALLPISYFKKQIEWFLNNKNNCFFIFLSDEPDFINKEFEYIDNKIISIDNTTGTDMAIMTLCNSAILSPSSFGWWGSYLMNDRSVVFSPKYWQGFNSKIEFHKTSTPSYSEKKDIE